MYDLSPGGELLQWASEVGRGKWEDLREAAVHVARKNGIRLRPSTLASQLTSLGHLDIDWEVREWSVARPTLNVVPGLGLCTLLTGSRPYYLRRQFDDATEGLDVYPIIVTQPPFDPRYAATAPAALFAKCASIEVAADVARRTGAEFVVAPATSLANALPSLDPDTLRRASPPDLDLDVDWFNPQDLTWARPHQPPRPGLYRLDLLERTSYLWYDQGSWCSTDLPEGQFLALRREHKQVMRWVAAPVGLGQSSRLEVRREVHLPQVAERAVTICDGKVPTLKGEWKRYKNVPRHVWQTIASRLGQSMTDRVEGEA